MSDRVFKFSKNSCNVFASIPNSSIAEIKAYVEPFITCTEISKSSIEGWLFFMDRLNTESIIPPEIIEVTISRFNEPNRIYEVYEEEKIINIVKTHDVGWSRQLLVRLIRDSLKNLSYNKGMRFLHGGMIKYKSKGICILGEKRGGKTTSILNLLSMKETEFIANDDLSIIINANSIIGFGWPRSISVRSDSFDALNSAQIAYTIPAKLSHIYNNPNNELSKQYITFYPKEFGELTESSLCESHHVDYIIITKFGKYNSIRELSKNEVATMINSFVEDDINSYFNELSPYFIEDERDNVLELNPSKQNIRAFEVIQNFYSLNNLGVILNECL